MITRDKTHRLLWFGLLATGVYATAVVLATQLATLERPEVLATALTLDLAVLLPAAFFFLVARPLRWSPATMVPVLVGGLLVAGRILPAERQTALGWIERGAFGLELGVLVWVALRARAAFRGTTDGGSDPLLRLRQAARDLIPGRRVAELLAAELSVLFFGLAAWRRAPHAPPETRAFTAHVRSGHGGLVFALVFASAIEGVVVHLLVMPYSLLLAWVLTAATAYGALWLVADYRALVLRPLLVDRRGIRLRAGLRWSARVPASRIATVQREAPAAKDALRMTLFGDPTLWIECRSPVVAHGPYGLRRCARWLGIAPDQRAEFEQEIKALTDGNASPLSPLVGERGRG